MKKIRAVLTLIVIIGVYLYQENDIDFTSFNESFASPNAPISSDTSSNASNIVYGNQQDGAQVHNVGKVVRILSDDNDGSRHQRIIVELASGQTLLIAHNIDIAPRIGSVSVNDSIEFNGVYESNTQGGVVHWTHHDPGGRHAEGWLKHKGQIYK